MTKRTNGEGSIRQRPDGRWEARLVYVDQATGQTKRMSFYGDLARDAKAKLKAAKERLDKGAPVKDASATVASWVQQWQRTSLAASSRKDTTKELMRRLLVGHVEPAPFGEIPLDRLKPSDIDGLILSMRSRVKTTTGADGIAVEPRALSEATIQRVFTILRVALEGAVRDGLLARNPAALVKQPSVVRGEAVHMSTEDVVLLLTAAKGTRCGSILSLIAATGLRKGEAMALTWDDIDTAAGSLTVRGTLSRVNNKLVVTEPKTTKSRRTLYPGESVLAMLETHRAAQQADREHAGNQWIETGFVFTTESGQPMDPRNVLRAMTTAATRAGIEGVNVHTLRHSAATVMLEQGVHIKAVADLLGHADIRVTASVYAHVSDDQAKRAMSALATAVGV